MDNDVMLYVCLSGDLLRVPMSLIPLCFNLYDMYMVRSQYQAHQITTNILNRVADIDACPAMQLACSSTCEPAL